ncbi:methyl-accepting chemotaxis protein [Endothiovibrio diazotrophicus]
MSTLQRFIGEPRSIRRRLLFLVVAVDLAMLVMAVWGHAWNDRLIREIAITQAVGELKQRAEAVEHNCDALLLNADHLADTSTPAALKGPLDELMARQEAALDELNGALERFGGAYREMGEVEEQLRRADAHWRVLADRLEPLLPALAGGDPQAAKRRVVAAIREPVADLHKEMERIGIALLERATEHSSRVRGYAESAKWQIKALLIVAIPLFAAGGLFFIGRIISPLQQLRDSMAAIVKGEGALSAKLPEWSGEVGMVAHFYNDLTGKIQSALLSIAVAAKSLDRASEKLAYNAEQTRLGLIGQGAEVADVIDKMHALEQDVAAVEGSTRGAAAAAEEAYGTSAQGQAVMGETIAVMERLDRGAGSAMAQVERVTGSVDRIGGVLEVIHKVAEQTNLLALNAAIEAARAGESGRGFAVVAGEVRNLAERTRESTEEINAIMAELRGNAEHAREAMAENRDAASGALVKVNEMARALGAIGATTENIAAMSHEISEAVSRQTSLAGEINRNTVNLDMTTRQAESNSSAMESLATELRGLVGLLNASVGQFNVENDEEIVAGLVDMERSPELSAGAGSAPATGDEGEIELF